MLILAGLVTTASCDDSSIEGACDDRPNGCLILEDIPFLCAHSRFYALFSRYFWLQLVLHRLPFRYLDQPCVTSLAHTIVATNFKHYLTSIRSAFGSGRKSDYYRVISGL